MRYLIPLLIIIGVACEQNQPAYLQKISELDNVEYVTFNIQDSNLGDTLTVSPWFKPGDTSQISLQHFADIEKYGSSITSIKMLS